MKSVLSAHTAILSVWQSDQEGTFIVTVYTHYCCQRSYNSGICPSAAGDKSIWRLIQSSDHISATVFPSALAKLLQYPLPADLRQYGLLLNHERAVLAVAVSYRLWPHGLHSLGAGFLLSRTCCAAFFPAPCALSRYSAVSGTYHVSTYCPA